MKFSIITICKDSMPYLRDCIKSVQNQSYKNIEHIIICSPSLDGTEKFLKSGHNSKIKIFFSKKKGIYTNLNLGIKKSKGKIIGILHSDDILFNKNIIKKIKKKFTKKIDLIYGNIVYCDRNNINIIKRIWKSSNYNPNKIKKGWMPPHTSIFIRRSIMIKNLYNEKYEISSDYDFIKKTFAKDINIYFTNLFHVKMRIGGKSTSIKYFFKKFHEDYNIINEGFFKTLKILIYKILSKINQLKI